ncbi:hypothetical protein [Bradyrhizobium sp. UFLA05-112]
MFWFRRNRLGSRARWRALRGLYWSFIEQNPPEARALRLLREWLSPKQRAQFDTQGHFDVTGCHTGRRYRICQGTMRNVLEIDEQGQAKKGWCFVPARALAVGDVMLAQKIALETDEMAVLSRANEFPPKQP